VSSTPISSTRAPVSDALRPKQGVAVELSRITKTYGGQTALNDLSLSARPGEFVALLGPSGCGKTTALRSLAGLEAIDSGTISIDGDDVTDQPTNKRDMGMVFQSYSLFPHLTAGENIEFGLRMRKVAAGERRKRAAEALTMVGLDDMYSRYAHELSGGQQQRVALARALVTRPRVLLLDEPLSALDAKVRVVLRDEIRRIQTELGITTFFVTHDQEEALAVADRVAVMQAGTIEQIGTPEELYQKPTTAFVAGFVGLSNRLPGVVSGGGVDVLGRRLPLVQPSTPDGPVSVLLRPEDVEFSSTDGVPGTVIASSFLGSLRRTQVVLADDTVISVQHSVRISPRIGENVHLALGGAPVAVGPREG
jgi:putative spermidine/putrescine transport system ATP-binding protein